MSITSEELRRKWIKFYESHGHKDVGRVSLIGNGETGVMFNVAGMQPLMPFLLGEKHPLGTRLCNVQGCIRTIDIEEVGDESHFTFFEMMGNWSLGDYFKKEKTAWSYELLTKVFGYDKDKIRCTVFEGDENAPRDEETAKYLMDLGIKKEYIYFLGKKDNWWNIEGDGTPCGPDNEWFYPINDEPCGKDCSPACDCGRYVEIGNDVYMQFEQLAGGKYRELKNKNVDTGFGFERNLMYLNNLQDGYLTDLFKEVIDCLSNLAGVEYDKCPETTKAIRIIADHTRTSVMLLGDKVGVVPSNTGAGYILRRMMRRAIRYIKSLSLETAIMQKIASIYIDKVYTKAYPELVEKKEFILSEIKKESDKFEKTLTLGTKELNKVIGNLEKFAPDNKKINGKVAFRLFDTFGFPLELTVEIAGEKGFVVDCEGFKKNFEEHQAKSKVEKGTFKGGLADNGEKTTNHHTAAHLLQSALKKVVSSDISQKGSNVTSERLRFDFNHDKPLTKEQIEKVEALVNQTISRNLDIVCKETTVEEAKNMGAIGVFNDRYGDLVKVYSIGDFSCEICGGPHAKNTKDLGKFKIIKEQSSSSGVRRIKAILE